MADNVPPVMPEQQEPASALDQQPVEPQATAAEPTSVSKPGKYSDYEIQQALSKLKQKSPALSDYLESSSQRIPSVDAAVDADLQKEIETERKYGSRPLEAAAESAASMASLGFTDQILGKVLPGGPERIREIRDRNEGAATGGTVVGALLPTGVAGDVAKGAEELGTLNTIQKYLPISAAAKLGEGAESTAAKVLENFLSDTAGRSKYVKEVLAKSAGMAAEGSVYGLGNLVSENALGKADFNGENALAAMGAGGLIGGSLGGAFGAIKASLPAIERGVNSISEPVKDTFSQYLDRAEATKSFLNPTVKEEVKHGQKFFEETAPDFMANNLGHGALETPYSSKVANEEFLASQGKRIDATVQALDNASKDLREAGDIVNPRFKDFYAYGVERLKALQPEYEARGDMALFTPIARKIDEFEELAQREKSFKEMTWADMNNLRKQFDEGAKWTSTGEKTTASMQANRELRNMARDWLDGWAAQISRKSDNEEVKVLAKRLTELNADYSTSATIAPMLARQVRRGRQPSASLWQSVVNTILPAAGNIKNNILILSDMEKANSLISNRIKEVATTFANKAFRAAKPISLKVLTASPLAKDAEGKAPSSREEAFINVQNAIAKLSSDPDHMANSLAKSTGRINQAAPQAAQVVHDRLTKAVQFLNQVMPKDSTNPGSQIFSGDYKPSSLEMAKFERYMQAIESPMSVLDDIESGVLTPEHVQALKAVYPDIYGRVVHEIMDNVSTKGTSLPYAKRVQLGTLFDLPTDPSLNPPTLQMLQSAFLAAPSTPPKGVHMPRMSAKGMSHMNFSGRAGSETQSFLSRRNSGK